VLRQTPAVGTDGALLAFIDRHPRLFVLTGAGCSTASGIPDYRDADGEWKRDRPVMLQAFLANEYARQRYWARSMVGWKRLRSARPNDAHRALATLEQRGRLEQLVTQNVDGLHQVAGSRGVIDLHGRADVVCCLRCNRRTARAQMQSELTLRNPGFAQLDALGAPDGDADLDALQRSDAMLIVGSSLMVYSGYRFAKQMASAGKPIAAVNLGRTQADDLFALKVEDHCATALASLIGQALDGS
jgi:NAD-dependent SIR2 family protein deacetylase